MSSEQSEKWSFMDRTIFTVGTVLAVVGAVTLPVPPGGSSIPLIAGLAILAAHEKSRAKVKEGRNWQLGQTPYVGRLLPNKIKEVKPIDSAFNWSVEFVNGLNDATGPENKGDPLFKKSDIKFYALAAFSLAALNLLNIPVIDLNPILEGYAKLGFSGLSITSLLATNLSRVFIANLRNLSIPFTGFSPVNTVFKSINNGVGTIDRLTNPKAPNMSFSV